MLPKQALKLLKEHDCLIVIVGDKHQDSTYVVRSEEELKNLCFNTIKDRLELGYYELPTEPEKPSLSKAEIEKFSGRVKQAAESEWHIYERELKHLKQSQEEYEMLQKASQGDFQAAFILLDLRQKYEYECFEVEIPTKIEPFQPFDLT